MTVQKAELQESKLGTIQYWDSVYSRELQNFKEFKEEGTTWFGDTHLKMLAWIKLNIKKDDFVLDIGTGNGHLIFGLNEANFENLIGIDYSLDSINLCNAIMLDKGIPGVQFKALDFLKQSDILLLERKFEFLVDKGTFDAISLSKHTETWKPTAIYVKNCFDLLNENGLLMISSCNWTEAEILDRFQEHFDFKERIKYPSFRFGGVEGSTVTTVILKRCH